jgi:N-acyl-phosphatidylethanolamine-hydrolysing phospholipase D
MKYVHVNPEEAVQVHLDIKSKMSFGIHWGTFSLVYTPYLEPRNRTKEAVKEKNISEREFIVPNLGETVIGVN